jgi:cell division protein FtsL
MFVVPLTVAIVLALVSELDSPRSGFIHAEQLRMERLQLDLEWKWLRLDRSVSI